MEPVTGRHPGRPGAALAVLGLLSEVAGEWPLTRVIDDANGVRRGLVTSTRPNAGWPRSPTPSWRWFA
jgi:hypothetical protein